MTSTRPVSWPVTWPLVALLLAAACLLAVASADAPPAASQVPAGFRLELVGELGGVIQAVGVSGDRAFAGDDRQLVVLDVGDPLAIREMGRSPALPGAVSAVALAGSIAWVTAGTEGLYGLDVSDPSRPRILGSVDTPGDARALALDGGHAFIAGGPAGIQVVDVTGPAAPRIVGGLPTPRFARDVAVHDGYAYVAERTIWEWVVRVIDVSDPTRPVETDVRDTPGGADAVAATDRHVFVLGWSGVLRAVQLYAFEITTPGRLALVGISTPAGVLPYGGASRQVAARRQMPQAAAGPSDRGYDVLAEGRYVYVADGTGVHVWDVFHPEKILWRGGLVTPGHAARMVKQGDRLFVAAWERGLRILDVADPKHVGEVGVYESLGLPEALVVRGNVVYLADGTGSLVTVDVSDPARPRAVHRTDTSAPLHGVTHGPDIAHRGFFLSAVGDSTIITAGRGQPVGTTGGLFLFDLKQPRLPDLAGTFRRDATRAFAMRAVAVRGTLAYAVGTWDLGHRYGVFVTANVVNPDRPVSVAALELSGAEPYGVAVQRDRAYIADRRWGVRIFDVGNRREPTEISVLAVPGEATGLAISGDRLYVAAGSAGLVILDLANPDRLAVLGSVDTPGDARRVALAGGLAIVADGTGGVRAIDVMDPGAPREIAGYDASGAVTDAAVDPDLDLVYATVHEARLVVLRFTTATPSRSPTAVPSGSATSVSTVPPPPTATATPEPPATATPRSRFTALLPIVRLEGR